MVPGRAHRGPAGQPLAPRRGARTCSACSARRPGLLRPFQRTVGDEVQAVLDDADAAVRDGRHAAARRRLVGRARGRRRSTSRSPPTPAPAAARPTCTPATPSPAPSPRRTASRVGARRLPCRAAGDRALAVGRASSNAAPTAGWEVVDALDEGLSHAEAGRRLGISQSAVSQRAQAAGLVDERRARRLAGRPAVRPAGGRPAAPRGPRRTADEPRRRPAARAAGRLVVVTASVALAARDAPSASTAPPSSSSACSGSWRCVAVVGGGVTDAHLRARAARSWSTCSWSPCSAAARSPRPCSGSSTAAAAGRTAMDRAGEVLRGGAWIGAFERCAVFAALVAGWPEGLAVVLALKGLGRYSELRGTPAGRTAWPPRAASRSGSSSARSPACCGPAPAPAPTSP